MKRFNIGDKVSYSQTTENVTRIYDACLTEIMKLEGHGTIKDVKVMDEDKCVEKYTIYDDRGFDVFDIMNDNVTSVKNCEFAFLMHI